MRIAFVSTMAAVPWSGSEELWCQAAFLALAQGHEVLSLTYDWKPRPDKLLSLAGEGAFLSFWSSANTYPEGNRKEGRPDYFPYHTLIDWRPQVVVVSNGGLLDMVNGHILLIELLLRLRIPYIVVVQANTELYKPSESQTPVLQAYFDHSEISYFVSRANLNLATRQLAAVLPKGRVINNPITLSETRCVEFPALDPLEEASFAAVGRLDVYTKGQDVLFQVLSTEQWRERSWSLTLYGSGDDESYLRRLAAFYRLSERIRFAGHISDIKSIWSNHHILLLPSRIEGTPLVLLEAMFCGRTAVVTDIGGSAEWIKDDENGFVASAPVPISFEEALERAWKRRAEWEVLGKHCYQILHSTHEIQSGVTLLDAAKSVNRGISDPPRVRVLSGGAPPLVSVIIPCFNLARYLRTCLESVFSQTFQDFEILVINPSSTDNTKEVAESVTCPGEGSARVTIYTISNYGQPAWSRNEGIKLAVGKYIVCLDADDFIAPTFLEKTVFPLEQNPDFDVAFSNFQSFEQDSEIFHTGPFDLQMLAVHNRLATCSLFRRSSWERVGGYKTNCAGYEDWDFWLSLAESGSRGIHIPETLFYHRVRQGSYLESAENKKQQLLARVILNHPTVYSEQTLQDARNILNEIGKNSVS
jgi:L-malate glycosyltransferase